MNKNLEILKRFIGEQNQRLQDDISKQGYKDDSPYRNNPSNTIYGTPQGTPITMDGVSKRLRVTDNMGNSEILEPNSGEHFFPGSHVIEEEIPVAQEGQEVINWTKKYVSSPKYKERLITSGYENADKQIFKRLQNLENVNFANNFKSQSSMYNPNTNTIEINYPADLEYYNIHKNLYPTKPELDSVIAHEASHSETNRENSVSSLLNKYDIKQLKNRLVPNAYDDQEVFINNVLKHDKSHHNVIPEENKADLNSFRYDLRNQYDAGTQDFTEEHLKNSPKSFAKERLLKNYSKEDLIWLMNNIAQNDSSNNQIPIAQMGGAGMMYADRDYQVGGDINLNSLKNAGLKGAYNAKNITAADKKKLLAYVNKINREAPITNLSDSELDRKIRSDKETAAQKAGEFSSLQNFTDANNAIDTHFRTSPKDNIFDDYINPGVWIGSMANKLGAIPQNINEGNYGEATMAVAEPLLFGAVEKIAGPMINKYIKSKRVLPIVGDYKVPSIGESWGKYKPVVSETEQGLEPYISKIGEPSISREEEVFRNSMGPEYRGIKELENTTFLDSEGNVISRPDVPQQEFYYGETPASDRPVNQNGFTWSLNPFGKIFGKELPVGWHRKIGSGKGIQSVIDNQALVSPSNDHLFFSFGKKPNENYAGVFNAVIEKNKLADSGIDGFMRFSGPRGRHVGVSPVNIKGKSLTNLPITDDAISIHRRLPFTNSYVPVPKDALINGAKSFKDILLTDPNLASLQKYGEDATKLALWLSAAQETGHYGAGSNDKDKYPFGKPVIQQAYEFAKPYAKDIYEGWKEQLKGNYEEGGELPKAQFGWFNDLKETVTDFFTDDDEKKPIVRKRPVPVERTLHITDPRKIRATTQQAIRPTADLLGGNYNSVPLDQTLREAKRQGLSKQDMWNLAGMALAETGLGNKSYNIGQVTAGPYDEGTPGPQEFVYAYMDKMKLADRLGVKDPAMRLQIYNGTGPIKRTTESNLRGYDMQKAYGVPIPEEGLSMKKRPLYGINVLDAQNNVLKKNPEFVRYIDSIYKAPVYQEGGEFTMQGAPLEDVIIQGKPTEFGALRTKLKQQKTWEDFANENYLGNFERNMGQDINNLPEYRKKEYEDYINKLAFDEYVKTHPAFKGEKRGDYIDRIQNANIKSQQFQNAYEQNSAYNDATDENKWHKGLVGLGSLIAPALTSRLKSNSHYYSTKEKKAMQENPISTQFGDIMGTLEPLTIPVESLYGSKSFGDIASGQNANIPMSTRILGDPMMLAFEAAPLLGKGLSAAGRALGTEEGLLSRAHELRQGLQTNGFLDMFKSKKPTTLLAENTTNVSKNLEDLTHAKDWAKQYGYDLPENLTRISQSDELTNRTIRGMMNRHNTFVRGVSTNWEELAKKNPEILRHLEGKGFDLSTKEGTKSAAEYMATHVPIQTGYGRVGLHDEVFKRGQDAIYTSNSIPTAEGYTYGQGYINKVKRPTDFSSANRQDWITQNNPQYYDNVLPKGINYNAESLNKLTPEDLNVFLERGSMSEKEVEQIKNYWDKAKDIKSQLYQKYKINEFPESLFDFKPEHDAIFDKYLDEVAEAQNKISKDIFNVDYSSKILRTERSNLPRDSYKYLLDNKIGTEDMVSWLKQQPYTIKQKEYNDLGESLSNLSWEKQKPIRDKMDVLKKEFNQEYNASVQEYMKKNHPDYDPVDRYSHYLHIGTPGEKILEPIQSWEITPEIWKNKSRAHSNTYTKKLSALKIGGSIQTKQKKALSWINS